MRFSWASSYIRSIFWLVSVDEQVGLSLTISLPFCDDAHGIQPPLLHQWEAHLIYYQYFFQRYGTDRVSRRLRPKINTSLMAVGQYRWNI